MNGGLIRRWLMLGAAIMALSLWLVTSSGASTSLALNGSFSDAMLKTQDIPCRPPGANGTCGTIQLVGLGAANWVYVYGPTFEPNGRCFDVDGTLTLTLQSDGSTISGPLTGLFCPNASSTGTDHGGQVSYGNPFVEDDTVALAGGTGQFSGFSGTASFHTFFAGARNTGTLVEPSVAEVYWGWR